MESKKLAHLHLSMIGGAKETLLCLLQDGSIVYRLYGGWSSSGAPYSLDNLQCTLPVDKEREDETAEEFVNRIIKIINKESIARVVRRVSTDITF